jgi:hypothetical protein
MELTSVSSVARPLLGLCERGTARRDRVRFKKFCAEALTACFIILVAVFEDGDKDDIERENDRYAWGMREGASLPPRMRYIRWTLDEKLLTRTGPRKSTTGSSCALVAHGRLPLTFASNSWSKSPHRPYRSSLRSLAASPIGPRIDVLAAPSPPCAPDFSASQHLFNHRVRHGGETLGQLRSTGQTNPPTRFRLRLQVELEPLR